MKSDLKMRRCPISDSLEKVKKRRKGGKEGGKL